MRYPKLQHALVWAAIDETRVRIEYATYPLPVTGYIEIPDQTLPNLAVGDMVGEYPDFKTIRVRYTRQCHAVKLGVDKILRLDTSAKDRQLGQRRLLWQANPFVMTPSGAIDIASSLKELLGVA